MTEEKQSRPFDEKKGEILLEIARKTIAERLGLSYDPLADLDAAVRDPVFESRRGTFVTLKINDQLRGCIGNLLPDKPLINAVQDNAVNAAFQDPRFTPLSPREFEKIQIEVSLLTEPRPLDYKDGRDLLDKLRPHVDGVILRKGPYSSTFLPQVWEQLPDTKTFLEQLCMKAGLPADAWQKGDIEVMTYQVQYFEESG
ncbi:MAG: AmmeMemoRadiSam system protein A [Desulfobacterales bacterium]|nr:AmmeMemoRadiSam system protein A [Desulfobacterales bacterium]